MDHSHTATGNFRTHLNSGQTAYNYMDPSSMTLAGLDLFRRQRRSRTQTDEKQFACEFPECGLRFYQKRNLMRHQSMKHGVSKSTARGKRHASSYTWEGGEQLMEQPDQDPDPSQNFD